MSEAWNEGYFTDVGYTYGYYQEISPVFQRYCLLLNGFATLESDSASHCELGFGQGVSISLHAAANPGHYVGTDFNPAQAAHATVLAEASGCEARLYDDSFEQFLNRSDLPQFDSISLHGIWTWVSRDNHRIIAEIARRHLKPGGVFYISYNCFPGWSPAYPLRQLFTLHDRFAVAPGGVDGRVDAALKFAEALLAANPIYAKAVPNLTERLKVITGQNRNYLAHEYFNREWNCMYFTDVVDALATAKLDFATSAMPLDTVDILNLAAEGVAFLKEIDHPILREQTRDYFVNQQFRKDIYVRGATRLSPLDQRERLLNSRFALIQTPELIPLKISRPVGEIGLQEAVYNPLIAELAAKNHAPKTLRELAASLPAIAWPQLLQAITVLVGMGGAAPCQSSTAAQQVRSRCHALNRYLCERALYDQNIQTLASPVTGGGISVSRFQQLFLLALGQSKKLPAEWAQFVWQVISAQGQKLIKEGKTLETAEENISALKLEAETFAASRLPILKALQVV